MPAKLHSDLFVEQVISLAFDLPFRGCNTLILHLKQISHRNRSVSLERAFIQVPLILSETPAAWSKCDDWRFIAKLHSCSIPASTRDAAFEE